MDFSYTERPIYHVLSGKQFFEPASLRFARMIAIRESSERMQGEAIVYGPDFFQETYRDRKLYCPTGYAQRLLAGYGRIIAHVLEHSFTIDGLLPYDNFEENGETRFGINMRFYREQQELEEAIAQGDSEVALLSEGADMLYYAACRYDQSAYLPNTATTYTSVRRSLLQYNIIPDEAEIFALVKYGKCRIFQPKNIEHENTLGMQAVLDQRGEKYE